MPGLAGRSRGPLRAGATLAFAAGLALLATGTVFVETLDRTPAGDSPFATALTTAEAVATGAYCDPTDDGNNAGGADC